MQRRVAAGVLSAGHARALLGLDDAEAQEELATRIVAEGLSVRATEELVALALAEGAGEEGRRRSAGPSRTRPALTDLADRLSDRFDTRVKVDIGRSKGKITIEFATVDDLERIVGIIGVPDQQLATKTERARGRRRPRTRALGFAAVSRETVASQRMPAHRRLASLSERSAAPVQESTLRFVRLAGVDAGQTVTRAVPFADRPAPVRADAVRRRRGRVGATGTRPPLAVRSARCAPHPGHQAHYRPTVRGST